MTTDTQLKYPDLIIKKGTTQASYVKAMKAQLTKLGFGPLDENNGTFWDATEDAVIAFQKSRLLNPDGEVGSLTWHRLFTDRIAVVEQATSLSGVALEIALSQLFVREKSGHNDGVEVESYLHAVGLGKGNPWCLAFQYWCFDHAAKKLGIGNPLFMTGGVLNLWNHTPAGNKVTEPQKGDLGVMDFGKGKGHIFLVKKTEVKKVATVEGNTSGDPTSSIDDRDGQGVFERLRPAHSPLMKGYIRYE